MKEKQDWRKNGGEIGFTVPYDLEFFGVNLSAQTPHGIFKLGVWSIKYKNMMETVRTERVCDCAIHIAQRVIIWARAHGLTS